MERHVQTPNPYARQCVDQAAAAAGETVVSVQIFPRRQIRLWLLGAQAKSEPDVCGLLVHGSSITHRAVVITQAIMGFELSFTYLIYHSNPMENELAQLCCREGKTEP